VRQLILFLLFAGNARAESAALEWRQLEVLWKREGAPAPARQAPPRAYAVPSLEVTGEIDGGRAQLQITVDVEVLADRWTIVPLLPSSLAVASALVTPPDGRRGLLVRDSTLALAADGAGHYRLELSAEGALDHGRLTIAPNGLAGGRAKIHVHAVEAVGGKTPWRSRATAEGLLVEAALGPFGVDLRVEGAAPANEAGATLEDLDAITVFSLGGSGVTRMQFQASADDSGTIELTLPKGARPWRIYVAGAAVPVATVTRGDVVRLVLKHRSLIEFAFTFEAPPMGIRGRYHLELPRLPVPVRGAHWDVWLPSGLSYGAPQAAMSSASCNVTPPPRARTPITPVGTCVGLERPVLETGRAYIEGKYDQPL
jgi:hypothetical protein